MSILGTTSPVTCSVPCGFQVIPDSRDSNCRNAGVPHVGPGRAKAVPIEGPVEEIPEPQRTFSLLLLPFQLGHKASTEPGMCRHRSHFQTRSPMWTQNPLQSGL